jgi:hypothetical protein
MAGHVSNRTAQWRQVSAEQPDDILPEQDLRCTKTDRSRRRSMR